jgi:hypothetical protein
VCQGIATENVPEGGLDHRGLGEGLRVGSLTCVIGVELFGMVII